MAHTVLQGKPGYILFLSLGFAILLGLGSLIAVSGTIGEVQSAGQQLRDKRAFFRADGSASLCLQEFRNRLQRDLAARLRTLTSLTAIGAYVSNNDPAGFLVAYAYQSGVSMGTAFQSVSSSEATLSETYTPTAGRVYACTLRAIALAAPANQGSLISPVYVFPYRYVIDGSATDGGLSRTVNLQGSVTVQVQQQSFAQYALFTNQQQNAAGATVWFSYRTFFGGLVHTNGKFHFNSNPAGTFAGRVESVSSTAEFYNNGHPVDLNADANGTTDVPGFGVGFERGAATIPMPALTTADQQRGSALGLSTGTGSSGQTRGVQVATTGQNLAGGIYVNGDASIALSAGTGNTGVYTIAQTTTTYSHGHAVTTTTTTTITVDYTGGQTTVDTGSGSPSTYTGVPNGMVFVDGKVTSLAGTVASSAQVTVAATGDVQLTNNLVYQNYTAGTTPSAEGTTNLLGVLSWNGNVRITPSASDNIQVHATVMAPNGEFTVDNYTSGSPRGTATILGGVIENTYGAFGTFSGTTPVTGYGRNFVYDTRMARGIAPPFFPTTGLPIGLIFGATNRPNWQQTQ